MYVTRCGSIVSYWTLVVLLGIGAITITASSSSSAPPPSATPLHTLPVQFILLSLVSSSIIIISLVWPIARHGLVENCGNKDRCKETIRVYCVKLFSQPSIHPTQPIINITIHSTIDCRLRFPRDDRLLFPTIATIHPAELLSNYIRRIVEKLRW